MATSTLRDISVSFLIARTASGIRRRLLGRFGGRFFDPFRPSVHPAGFSSEAALNQARDIHLANVRTVFETADVLVVTLGLTEGWINLEDDATYPICPGCGFGIFNPSRYAFKNFSLEDTTDDLEDFLRKLRERNPRIRIVLTVSPIPLAATYERRHVLYSTVLSKSILRIVCDSMFRKFDNVDYFPSYEIVNFGKEMSSYFTGDLRTVADVGIDHVMTVFFRRFCGDDIESRAGCVKYMEAWCDESYLIAPWYSRNRGDQKSADTLARHDTEASSRSKEIAVSSPQKEYVFNRVDTNERFPHPLIGFRGRPNGIITRFVGPGNPHVVKMDHNGYWNSADIRNFMDDRRKRVAVVGSSTIADFQKPKDQNVCSLLQRRFTESGRDEVLVINCGIVTSVSTQDLANLTHHVLDLDPAVIVVYTGGSDVIGALVGDPRPGYTTNFHVWEEVLTSYRLWVDTGDRAEPRRINAEFDGFDLSLENRRRAAGFGSEEWLNAIFENYRRVVIKMRALCLGANAKLLLINQPTAPSYRLDHKKTFETPTHDDLYEIDVIRRSEIFRQYVIPRNVAGEFVAVDWASMFDDEPTLPYVDRVHSTVGGYEKIAARMFEEITRQFEF